MLLVIRPKTNTEKLGGFIKWLIVSLLVLGVLILTSAMIVGMQLYVLILNK